MEFIGDNRGVFIALGLIGFLASGGYVVWRMIFATASTSALGASESPRTPVPSTRPGQNKTPSLAAGQAEYAQRGHAKTVKVAPVRDSRNTTTELVAKPRVEVSDDDARDSLFSGLGENEQSDSNRRAERMEELHLHPTPNRHETAKVDPHSAPLPGAVPAQPRSQTADLDDILSRIDKVLAENPVMASSTITPESATDAQKSKAAEATAKTEPVANPTADQQKLF